MAQPPLDYKQRAQVALLANVALRTVDAYFTRKFLYKTQPRERIAAALRAMGRAHLIRW